MFCDEARSSAAEPMSFADLGFRPKSLGFEQLKPRLPAKPTQPWEQRHPKCGEPGCKPVTAGSDPAHMRLELLNLALTEKVGSNFVSLNLMLNLI